MVAIRECCSLLLVVASFCASVLAQTNTEDLPSCAVSALGDVLFQIMKGLIDLPLLDQLLLPGAAHESKLPLVQSHHRLRFRSYVFAMFL